MIKRLAGCIRQYKRDTVLTPLFMLGEVSCECVIPLLTAELINNIQAGCSMNVILQFGLKLFLVAMLSLGLRLRLRLVLRIGGSGLCPESAPGFIL